MYKNLTWFIGILIFNVAIDQITKEIARLTLRGHEVIEVVGSYCILLYVENKGAFLSLGADLPQPWHFIILTLLPGLVIVGLIIYFAFKIPKELNKQDWYNLIGFATLAGGGLSNLYDRIVNEGVTDFMNVGIGDLRTGVFNVADLSIIVGGIFLILASYQKEKLIKS